MFSNTLIDRETINSTLTACTFDPYLPTYYAMQCTCGTTIEGRKVPIKHNMLTYNNSLRKLYKELKIVSVIPGLFKSLIPSFCMILLSQVLL